MNNVIISPSLVKQPLASALRYADRGWPVFPCKRDKTPYTLHGFQDASTDADQINLWWAQWPEASIGIATGARSGIGVLDVDPRHGGEESLAALEEQHGSLPLTYQVQTGSGGLHYYFQWIHGIGCSSSKLGPGLDFKGEGGYVIAAGSLHASGNHYVVLLEEDIADAPIWLINALSRPSPTVPTPDPSPIQEGQRNDHLFRLACSLRAHEWDHSAILTHLLAVNRTQCLPPLLPAEVRRIAKSATQYPPGFSEIPPPADSPQQESADPLPSPYPTDDTRAARFFLNTHPEQIVFCEKWGKFGHWCGTHWEQKTVSEMHATFSQWIEDHETMLLAEPPSPPQARGVGRPKTSPLQYAHSLLKSGNQDALIRMIRDLCLKKFEVFDAYPFLVATQNGTLDLTSGSLSPASPAHYITRCVPLPYLPEARCPHWEQFLFDIMQGREDLINFLWKAIGYSLTGSTKERVLFLCYGVGNNGKSTLLRILRTIFGPHAMTTPFHTFLASRTTTDAVRNDLAGLAGARLVMAHEADEGRSFAEAFIKTATGGDSISARFLFQEYFTFQPEFKLWLAFNHYPRVRGTDPAIWNRIRLIPFTRVFVEGTDMDKDIGEKLLTEVHGIFSWAVRGAIAWQTEGLPFPDAVRVATREYREEMDTVGMWFSERCEPAQYCRVKAIDLYNDFIAQGGDKLITIQKFSRELTRLGVERDENKRWVRGVRLRIED